MILERSANGIDFSNVASYSNGSGTPGGSFRYDDNVQSSAVAYYRVKFKSLLGQNTYSIVVQVKNSNSAATLEKLKGKQTIIISTSANWQNAELRILNMQGANLMQIKTKSSRIDIQQNLSAGLYVYQITLDGQVYSGKLFWD